MTTGVVDALQRGGEVELLLDRDPRRRALGPVTLDARVEIVVARDPRARRDVRHGIATARRASSTASALLPERAPPSRTVSTGQ